MVGPEGRRRRPRRRLPPGAPRRSARGAPSNGQRLAGRVSAARHHLRRPAHAHLPAAPPRPPPRLGRRCGTRARGSWRSPRAWRAAPSTATWPRLCAFLGTPAAEVRLGVARSRRARRRALAARRVPDPGRAALHRDQQRRARGIRLRRRDGGGLPGASGVRSLRPERAGVLRASDHALVDAVVAEGRAAQRAPAEPRIAIVDWAEREDPRRPGDPARGLRRPRLRLRPRRPARAELPRRAAPRARRVRSTSSTGAPSSRSWCRGRTRCRAFLDAYESGLVPFVNSFRCRLSEDKAFFAVLTDEAFAGLLTDDERAFVDRLVPWTRKVAERHTRAAGTRGRPRAPRPREPRGPGPEAGPRLRRATRCSWATRPSPRPGRRRC